MIGRYILLLTTTGRKSGLPRHTPLEYEYDRENDRYRIAAGWGGNTDWYRNLLANPQVTIQVGNRKFSAIAEPASDEEVARYMLEVSQRHPRMDHIWNRWSDQLVDGTFESYVRAAKYFPSVWLTPSALSGTSPKFSKSQNYKEKSENMGASIRLHPCFRVLLQLS